MLLKNRCSPIIGFQAPQCHEQVSPVTAFYMNGCFTGTWKLFKHWDNWTLDDLLEIVGSYTKGNRYLLLFTLQLLVYLNEIQWLEKLLLVAKSVNLFCLWQMTNLSEWLELLDRVAKWLIKWLKFFTKQFRRIQ